ncbi:NAD(P)-binding protein [Panus rudis PR-1116 ss-1]|nr:NAD(P)-binding protein [Panus rudis PR-1116 ss-1]
MPNIPPVLTTDLSGKTVLVTGANIGLGLEVAKHFARMNPQKLIVTTRSVEKGEATVAAIARETGFTRTEARVLELTRFDSVLSFVDQFKKENSSLNILVANAAIALTKFELTPDNWETERISHRLFPITVYKVNHLSTALLTFLLLPLLSTAAQNGSPSRAVIVSSGIHASVSLSGDKFASNVLEKLSTGENYECFTQYSYSKLLNILFTRALARHLAPTSGVIVDTVTPGYFFSGPRRYNEDQTPFNTPELKAIEITAEQASRNVIYAAIAGKVNAETFQGAYISSESQIIPPSDWVLSAEGHRAEEQIWAETIEILSKVSPDLQQIVNTYTKA